jgi:hypothetical protein
MSSDSRGGGGVSCQVGLVLGGAIIPNFLPAPGGEAI